MPLKKKLRFRKGNIKSQYASYFDLSLLQQTLSTGTNSISKSAMSWRGKFWRGWRGKFWRCVGLKVVEVRRPESLEVCRPESSGGV